MVLVDVKLGAGTYFDGKGLAAVNGFGDIMIVFGKVEAPEEALLWAAVEKDKTVEVETLKEDAT